MTISYNWAVTQMDRKTADGFVTTAHWTCFGQDASLDGEFSGSVYSTVSFEGELSVPYESLTEATVLGWVWEKIDKEATEAAVAAQIAEAKAPAVATGLPW